MVELRWFDDADSMTVMTVMLKTTVTASAMTRAKPRSCSTSRRRCIVRRVLISDPRAVAEVDLVCQLVRPPTVAFDTHGEDHLQRGQAAATGLMRVSGEGVRDGQVIRDLYPRAGAARRTELPVEGVPVGVVSDGRR